MPNKLTLACLAFGFVLWLLPSAWAADIDSKDTDQDQIPDYFEIFSGLDPANPADALLDYDGDNLNNLSEYRRGSDPWEKDTDRDGLSDGPCDGTSDSCLEDAYPVSRAYLQLGNPRYTLGDFYSYFHPCWLRLVFKSGGEWGFDESCGLTAWQVDATEKPGVGSLNLKFQDRTYALPAHNALPIKEMPAAMCRE